MSKLGSAFSKAGVSPMGDAAPDSAEMGPPSSAADVGADKAEVAAYKLMKRAKSDEEGAAALKKFIEICTSGGY